MRYKKGIAAIMVMIMLAGLSGCGSEKTIEEQVTENLLKAGQLPETTINYQENMIRENNLITEVAGEYENDEQENVEQEVNEAEKEETAKDAAESKKEDSVEEVNVQDDAKPHEEPEETIEETVIKDENKLQIVFLGDSIFDNARDGTGIPYLVGVSCDANIYNLAIGGCQTALFPDESSEREKWTSLSILGIARAITGYVKPDFFADYYAKKVFDTCDFSKTDYFVIEAGINDFLAHIPIQKSKKSAYDPYSYYGAVELMVNELKECYPDATIIFVTPHYERFFGRDNLYLGDCNTVNLGLGTLSEYIAAGYDAALISGAVPINAYNEIGIDGYTAEIYLEDGIHLTGEGRRLYADVLAHKINYLEINKAN